MALSIAALSANKSEGNSGTTPFTFLVTRTGVDFTRVSSARWDVSAVPGQVNSANTSDFPGGRFPTGTVSFAAGETSKTITVSVLGDTTVEPNEPFRLTLSAPSTGTSLGTAATATGTILNDDQPPPALSIAALSANKSEGNSGITPFTFLVTRTGDSTGVSSARWTVSAVPRLLNSAKTTDFSGGRFPTGSVAFAAGETSKTVTVGVLGDITAEANEPFRITLSAPSKGTILGTAATATGTILNDDKPPPALSITALSADKREGNSGTTSFTFRVTRTGDLTGVSTAAWSVSGVGSAPNNAGDFSRVVIPSGRVTFAAGQTSQTITVNVAGEAAHERDETFRVTLSGASAGTTLAKAFATGTIRNDDAATPASFAIAPLDAVQPEGLKGSPTPFTFLITRNGLSSGTSSVAWSANGAGSPSVGPGDFVPSRGGGSPFGALTFSANETVKAITVNINGDFSKRTMKISWCSSQIQLEHRSRPSGLSAWFAMTISRGIPRSTP